MFKHRELSILSRRPPLQWCVELRYLSDPMKVATTTTTKPLQTFPGHFMKKYEKYLRKDGQSTGSGSTSNVSYRKSNNELLADSQTNVDNKYPVKHRDRSISSYGGGSGTKSDESKRLHYDKIWPKSKNLRKKYVKPTEIPTKGLTALASFPVSFIFRPNFSLFERNIKMCISNINIGIYWLTECYIYMGYITKQSTKKEKLCF